jgi:hypothetical protein
VGRADSRNKCNFIKENILVSASALNSLSMKPFRPKAEGFYSQTEHFRPGTEALRPGTETLRPGTETLRPGTETLRPGTEALRPGTETFRPGTDLAILIMSFNPQKLYDKIFKKQEKGIKNSHTPHERSFLPGLYRSSDENFKSGTV